MHGSPCCCTTDGVKPEQQSDRISATQEVKKIQFSSIIAHKNIDVSSCNTSKSPKTTRNYQTAKPEHLRGRRVWNHHHTIKLLRKIEGNRMIHARTHFIDVTSFSQAFDNDIIYIYIYSPFHTGSFLTYQELPSMLWQLIMADISWH